MSPSRSPNTRFGADDRRHPRAEVRADAAVRHALAMDRVVCDRFAVPEPCKESTMSAALNYPGVYVEEVPSTVRTITGVATSITAFVGRARRGPMDDDPQGRSPVRIHSFADFERTFGGLWDEAPMSFAVNHYFQNGGSDALIVRVGAGALTPASLVRASVTLRAASPGTWGNEIEVTIDHRDGRGGVLAAPLFNLALRDRATDAREAYFGLSTDAAHPRAIERVLLDSSLARATVAAGGARPAVTALPPAALPRLVGGQDGGTVGSGQILDGAGIQAAKRGMYALQRADLFNILVIPPYSPTTDVGTAELANAVTYCRERRAILLVDPPTGVTTVAGVTTHADSVGRHDHAALFFPRLRAPNPLRDNALQTFAPSGAVAGVLARTDANRGVWKSAAGIEATLNGVPSLADKLTDQQNGELNPLGVNCLRDFPIYGRVAWGARTLAGADALASEWKYLAVRRMAFFLEESLFRGTQWVVFEPNDEPLWSQIRLNVGAFLQNLFRQGAFKGRTPREAYFVKCDAETTTQNDIDLGIVNIAVGFAPLKPAEFVVIKLQQIAGDIAT
jgi:uncharacterized protein